MCNVGRGCGSNQNQIDFKQISKFSNRIKMKTAAISCINMTSVTQYIRLRLAGGPDGLLDLAPSVKRL